MDTHDARREAEALIEAIWGAPAAAATPPSPDAAQRARQNAELATAMRAYLQAYLVEAEGDAGGM